jgi:hypothetical protein
LRYPILFIISVVALTTLSLATAQSSDPAIQGYRLSFLLGQEYQKVTNEGGSADAYNSLVEQWNAFVRTNYGNGTNMEFKPMGSENANLQKPIAIGKNTTGNGIVHSVDGSGKYAPSYTTNDANLLPESARNTVMEAQRDKNGNVTGYKNPGAADYLGGV